MSKDQALSVRKDERDRQIETNIIPAPNTKYAPLTASWTELKFKEVSSLRDSSTLLIAFVWATTCIHGESIKRVPHMISVIDMADFIFKLVGLVGFLRGRTPWHHPGRVVNVCTDQARMIEPLGVHAIVQVSR